MIKLKNLHKILCLIFFCATAPAPAQNLAVNDCIAKGDSLHSQYDFTRALESYSLALEQFQDSLITESDSLLMLQVKEKMLLSENGQNMASFVDRPTVVAKHRFAMEDFFLYYPLQERSWRPTPNALDSKGDKFARAIYAPERFTVLYYSTTDEESIRNIYMTEQEDTLWTLPTLINEHMTSDSDEIYPMLSPDGKQLYFASKGLYGAGGYDLYVSEWDEEQKDWSVPLNMGFPYSSPADDFLFVNTDDGKYSIFASNRECQSDSVWVYVLEFNNMPVRRQVDDPQELKKLAELIPQAEEERVKAKAGVVADIPENTDTERYMSKMSEVRALRDTISLYTLQLDNKRAKFAVSSDDDERMKLTNDILAKEAVLPHFRDSLDKAMLQLQKIEMEFLFKGVVIDPDKLLEKADQEVVGEATRFTFSKSEYGAPLRMDFKEPEVKFDYSFKILPTGCFAEDNTIPEGIVYQIQIFSSSYKAGVKNLKGLSPVFERKTVSGRYVYRVGLFSSYKDVLSHLNAVKKVGFRTAFIVAYMDGKEVSVSKARTAEQDKSNNPVFYEVQLTLSEGGMDSSLASEIKLYSDGKDIARVTSPEGLEIYKVGPFSDKSKADLLVAFLKEMGIDDVLCNELGK